jgi:two-component system C4-dicarboxylate transport response regulator DctD
VLLVEDEESVAAGICSLLEAEGLEVHLVTTGAEAEPAVRALHPDVLVLDLGLPDIDGLALFAELRTRWPELPVLFSTGHGNPALLPLKAGGGVGFLQKPYDGKALVTALHRITSPGRG